ncbi:MAG: Fic family protein [Candidatus Omnitrophota bacterium]
MDAIKWKPIEDLPNDLVRTESNGLSGISAIWIEQSEKLKKSQSVARFNQQLKREWAIETGIIENLYSIDRGITQVLIEKGIHSSLIPHGSTDKPIDLVVSIITDQHETLDFLFDHVANRRALSTAFIKEIHALLTRNQRSISAIDQLGHNLETPLIKGDWKKLPNNPKRPDGAIHEYCPPEQVASEMDRLLSMHLTHQELTISPEIQAAWLHHRFTQIHPFQDGNGRVARCLTSMIFIKAKWFPLVVHRDLRSEYIDSCERADQGDLHPLIALFTKIQKKSFIKALSLSETVLTQESKTHFVIDAAVHQILSRIKVKEKERENAFLISMDLERETYEKLTSVCNELKNKFNKIASDYYASVEKSDEINRHWFRKQIIEMANKLNYFADTRTYAKWVRLKIIEERRSEIVISFHSLGVNFLGVIAGSAFIEYRDKDEDDAKSATIDGPYPIAEDIFQFSYNENESDIRKRYREWLDQTIVTGLDQWRRQL